MASIDGERKFDGKASGKNQQRQDIKCFRCGGLGQVAKTYATPRRGRDMKAQLVATLEARKELEWPEEQQVSTLPEMRHETPDHWVLAVKKGDRKIQLEKGETKLIVDCAA